MDVDDLDALDPREASEAGIGEMDTAKGSTGYIETQVPEWEHVATGRTAEKRDTGSKPQRSIQTAFLNKLDSVLPRHKTYLGLSRKAFLWCLLISFVLLLVLIIGLAVGLNQGSG